MDAAAGPAAGDDGSVPCDAVEEQGEWQTVEGKKKQQRRKGGREEAKPPLKSSSSSSNRPEPPQQQQQAEDSDSDSDDSDDKGGFDVQLGFAEPMEPEDAMRLLFRDPNWHDWDGGKIGGKPVRASCSFLC